jgi:hypothetical protein
VPTLFRICRPALLVRLGALLPLCLGLAVHSDVQAQRSLPEDAKYAAKAQFNYPFVKVGKPILRLSVGSKIYNEQNLIIMPNTAPSSAAVLYKVDTNGEISQIWILTPEEAKAASARK